jgi:exodeoxyribonuclease VII small subunit
MAESSALKDIEKLSFEDALKELESIVKDLEGGKSRLEDAIAAYERGAALKRHCEAKLAEARAKVERIRLDAEGNVNAVPADEEGA